MDEIKKETKVAVVGSRSIQDKQFVFNTLDFYLARLLKEYEVIIVSGEQPKGVDGYAKQYSKERRLGYIGFPPRYDLYHPKQAPLERNSEIVNESDYLIAIQHNKSSGTQDSINKACKKGIKVKVINYEK
jgi:hypothetical protein